MISNARRRLRVLGVGVAVLVPALVAASPAAAGPGDLDPRFGDGGRIVTAFGQRASKGNAVARDGGKLVVAGAVSGGGNSHFALARYRRDGALDGSFSGDGRRVTSFRAGDAIARGVAIEPDGDILVAGQAGQRIAVARYKENGRLDPSFGRDGKVVTNFPGASDVSASDVAIQENGRIVVVGTYSGGGQAPPSSFAVARYRRGGKLDQSFGTRGRVTTGFGVPGSDLAVGNAVLVQPNGRIVAAGSLNNPFAGGGAFALARYKRGGDLDPSFGGAGRVTTPVGNEGGAIDLVRQRDGSLVAGGESAQPDPPGLQSFFTLIRYGEDGEQDTGFGPGGIVRTTFPGSDDPYATGVAIQGDGRIVAVGPVGLRNGSSVFGVARYRPGGSLDRQFGGDGRVRTRFAAGSQDQPNGVTIQPGRGIVAAGSTAAGIAMARYLMAR